MKIIVLIYQVPKVTIPDSISFHLIICYGYHRPRTTLLWFNFTYFRFNLVYFRRATPVYLFFLERSKWEDSQTPKLHQHLYSSSIKKKKKKRKKLDFHVTVLDLKCLFRKICDYLFRWQAELRTCINFSCANFTSTLSNFSFLPNGMLYYLAIIYYIQYIIELIKAGIIIFIVLFSFSSVKENSFRCWSDLPIILIGIFSRLQLNLKMNSRSFEIEASPKKA